MPAMIPNAQFSCMIGLQSDIKTGMCRVQKHHGSREVFLSDLVDNNEMECLDEVVPVCSPGSEHTFDGYLDVYTCEYEYDATWQVIKITFMNMLKLT